MHLTREHTEHRRPRGRTLGAAVLAAVVAVGATGFWVSPASAGKLKGKISMGGDKGRVIRPTFADVAIIAPGDANGETRLAGLAPGTYTVKPIFGAQPVQMKVDADGALAFTTDDNRKGADPRAGAPRTNPSRGARPQPWAVQISEPGPCNEPYTCINLAGALDLNTANAEEIAKYTGTSMQSAVHIMVQREKGGRYTSIEDFARRNCRTNAIAMEQGVVKIAEATVVLALVAGKPSVPGLQCQPNDVGQFSLYGKKHNYVGHVTLLR